MIDPTTALIAFLKANFPDYKAGLGVGKTVLASDRIVTVNATGLPLDSSMRGGKWVCNFSVFDVNRSRGLATAAEMEKQVVAASNEGLIGKSTSGSPLQLPTLVDNGTGSQAHTVIAFSTEIIGHFG